MLLCYYGAGQAPKPETAQAANQRAYRVRRRKPTDWEQEGPQTGNKKVHRLRTIGPTDCDFGDKLG